MKNKIAGKALLSLFLVLAILSASCLTEIEEKVVVTFDANGGDPTPVDRELTKGDKLGSVPDPTKSTDQFLGWFDNFDLYDADTEVYNDITLVAKWRSADERTVTVTFDAPGAVPPVTVIEVVIGKSLGPLFPVDPRKQGSWFDGWKSGSAPFTKNDVVNADITVTAAWRNKAEYTVTLSVSSIHQGVNPGVNDTQFKVYEGDSIDEWEQRFPLNLNTAADPNTNQFYRFFRWSEGGSIDGIIYTERTPIEKNVALGAVFGLYFKERRFDVDLSTLGKRTVVPGGAGIAPGAPGSPGAADVRTPKAKGAESNENSAPYDPATGLGYNPQTRHVTVEVNAGPCFINFHTPAILRPLLDLASTDNETKFRWEVEYEFEDPARETDNNQWNFLIANLTQGDNWNTTAVVDLTLKDISEGKFNDIEGKRPGIGELHDLAATNNSNAANRNWVVIRAGRSNEINNGPFKITFKAIRIVLVQ